MSATVECPKCKRRIALGRAACTFCGAALPASEAPAPAPAAGPKRYDYGNLVEASLAPGDTGSGPLRMRFKGATLKSPAMCACCLEPSQTTRPVSADNLRTLPGEMMTNTYKVETRKYTFQIPYCSHCGQHVKGTLKKPTCVGASADAVALTFHFEQRELVFTFLNRAFGQRVLELNRS